MHVFEPLSPLEQFVDIVKRCPVAKEKKNITRDGKIYDWPVCLPSPKKTTQSTNLPPSELVPGRISRGETSGRPMGTPVITRIVSPSGVPTPQPRRDRFRVWRHFRPPNSFVSILTFSGYSLSLLNSTVAFEPTEKLQRPRGEQSYDVGQRTAWRGTGWTARPSEAGRCVGCGGPRHEAPELFDRCCALLLDRTDEDSQ